MPATYEESIDQMFALINTDWLAKTTAITGYVPHIYWPGVEEKQQASMDKFWVRVSQQTVTEEQSTFRNGSFCKSYTATGLLFAQLFCPKSDASAMEKGRKLGIVLRDALRGKSTSGNVWFRRVFINELSPELKWYRLNVIAEYEYDEQA